MEIPHKYSGRLLDHQLGQATYWTISQVKRPLTGPPARSNGRLLDHQLGQATYWTISQVKRPITDYWTTMQLGQTATYITGPPVSSSHLLDHQLGQATFWIIGPPARSSHLLDHQLGQLTIRQVYQGMAHAELRQFQGISAVLQKPLTQTSLNLPKGCSP